MEARKVLKLCFQEFVYPWYTTITEDKELRRHLKSLIIQMIWKLEKRVNNVDLVAFAFQDVPYVLVQHVKQIREAKNKERTTFGGDYTFQELFQKSNCHFAMKNQQQEEVFFFSLFLFYFFDWLFF